MKLYTFLESLLHIPQEIFFEEDEDIIKGNSNKYKAWYHPESNKFFILPPGSNHLDGVNVKKAQKVGWIKKEDGKDLQEVMVEKYNNNELVKITVDLYSKQEPIIINTGPLSTTPKWYQDLKRLIKKKTGTVDSEDVPDTAEVKWGAGNKQLFRAPEKAVNWFNIATA